MSAEELHDRLLGGVRGDSADAVVTITADYEPAGGPNAKLYPPTYPLDAVDPSAKQTPYVFESRLVDGEATATVLLDSVQSQSNRVEEALQEAVRRGDLSLGYLDIQHRLPTGRVVSVTSFTAPHRAGDAYIRDALLDGVVFDRTPVGQRLRAATAEDCASLYEREPLSLILGFWDSHRKGRQLKIARSYRSEIFGIAPERGRRAAGRMDPHNLIGVAKDAQRATDGSGEWVFQPPETAKAVKGEKLSEIGHGNIAPQAAHGGVTARHVRRIASLSLAGLARLRFGDAEPAVADEARVALAALALLGDRLAFGRASLWLRSGCELVLLAEQVGFQQRGGGIDPVEASRSEIRAVFDRAREASAAGGLVMQDDVLRLAAGKGLAKALDYAYLQASGEEP